MNSRTQSTWGETEIVLWFGNTLILKDFRLVFCLLLFRSFRRISLIHFGTLYFSYKSSSSLLSVNFITFFLIYRGVRIFIKWLFNRVSVTIEHNKCRSNS